MTTDFSRILTMALAVGAGGTLGALARWSVGLAVARLFTTELPLATITVNLVGSFIFGLLFGLVERGVWEAPMMQAMVFTGFLGAFTTFSTFSMDALGLGRLHGASAMFLYLGVSVVGGLMLAWLGLRITGA
jgi:CrcB protein